MKTISLLFFLVLIFSFNLGFYSKFLNKSIECKSELFTYTLGCELVENQINPFLNKKNEN